MQKKHRENKNKQLFKKKTTTIFRKSWKTFHGRKSAKKHLERTKKQQYTLVKISETFPSGFVFLFVFAFLVFFGYILFVFCFLEFLLFACVLPWNDSEDFWSIVFCFQCFFEVLVCFWVFC